MRAVTTLPEPADVQSSEFRVAISAIVSSRDSYGLVPGDDGNCHAHDLVSTWARLTNRPMPIPLLLHELRDYRLTNQRGAVEALAWALLFGDVRLVPLAKRDRR